MVRARGVAAGDVRVTRGRPGGAALAAAVLPVAPGRHLTGALRPEGLAPRVRYACRVVSAREAVEGEGVIERAVRTVRIVDRAGAMLFAHTLAPE